MSILLSFVKKKHFPHTGSDLLIQCRHQTAHAIAPSSYCTLADLLHVLQGQGLGLQTSLDWEREEAAAVFKFLLPFFSASWLSAPWLDWLLMDSLALLWVGGGLNAGRQ